MLSGRAGSVLLRDRPEIFILPEGAMIGITIIRREEQECSRWPGGIMTQLAVWPQNAGDKAVWRMDAVDVETTEAAFTVPPGMLQHIMPLEEGMTLARGTEKPISLGAFETARIDGGKETLFRVPGQSKAFSLTVCPPYSGHHGWICSDVESLSHPASPSLSFEGIYTLSEEVKLVITATPGVASYSITLRRKDFLLIAHKNTEHTIQVLRHKGTGDHGVLCVTADAHMNA